MYLIPSNPRVFNIKWDRDATRYQVPAGVPALPPPPPAAAAVVTRIPFVQPAALPRPVAKRPCRACHCSPKGITAAPQKRLGQLGQTAGVPAGTVLAYSATWPQSIKGPVNQDPNTVQSQIQGTLAGKWGIVVDTQQHSTSDILHFGAYSFILQVHTTSDYGSQEDIRANIDHEIYGYLNLMPQSTIRTVQAVSPSGVNIGQQTYPPEVAAQIAAAQAGLADALARGDQSSAAQYQNLILQLQGKPKDPLTWLSDNWPWVLGGGIALVAAKELL